MEFGAKVREQQSNLYMFALCSLNTLQNLKDASQTFDIIIAIVHIAV